MYIYIYWYVLSIPVSTINSLVWSWTGITWSRPLRLFLNYLSENYLKLFLNYFSKNINILEVLSIMVSTNKYFGNKLNGMGLIQIINAILGLFCLKMLFLTYFWKTICIFNVVSTINSLEWSYFINKRSRKFFEKPWVKN